MVNKCFVASHDVEKHGYGIIFVQSNLGVLIQ